MYAWEAELTICLTAHKCYFFNVGELVLGLSKRACLRLPFASSFYLLAHLA